MKFKNSYILLIAMAIFLLVSIGSACASENFTTDSDAQLATADADVVFADENGDITLNDGETTQEKINTTVNADSDKEKYSYDDDKNITVTVKDNESNNLEISKNNLTVFEGNNSINFTYNNSKITILDKLAVGNHTLIINYLGNANYTNSSTEFLLKIFGNYTLETQDTVLSDDGKVIIPVKVFDGVEYVELNKNYVNLTLTYTNSTGNKTSENITLFDVANGNITFTIDKTKFVAASINLNYTNAVENKTILLRLATKIDANNARIKVNENKTINVKVLTAETEELTINETNLKVLINGKDTSFAYNNSVITLNIQDTGSYNVTIIYIGNDTYYTSNKTVKLNVWGNQTINPPASANIDKNNKVNITINLSDGAEPVNVNLSKLNVTLFYKVNNQTLNKTINGIELSDDNQTISFKVTESFESAYVTIKYAAENNLTANTALKMATNITAKDSISVGAGEVVNFTIEIQTLNGTKINVTDKNIKILSNGKEVKFTCNNSVISLTDKYASYGINNLTINYLGTEFYETSTKNITLTVYAINATSSIKVNSTKKGEVKINIINGNETINITAKDLILNVTYKNGNDTVVINVTEYELKNGTLYFTLQNGTFTTATLTIKYNQTETNVTLNRIYNARIEAVTIVNEYKNGNFTFRLVDVDDNSNIAGRSISLYTTGNIRAGFSATTDSNGIASFRNVNLYVFDQNNTSLNMKPLEVGKYLVEISVSDPIKATSLNTNLTVTPANIKIVIDPYKEYYGSDKNITITVTNAKNGEILSGIILKLSMPQTSGQYYYVSTDSNGVGRISAKGLVGGDYDLTVSNNDTVNIVNTSTKTKITVLKIPTTINAKDVTVYYNTGTTATIKVTDKSGKPVAGMYILIQFDKDAKKTYLFQTDSNGKITFSASLAVGTHKMTISSADSRYDAKSVTKTIKVKKASGKIKAKKVTTYYKGGKYFTVKLINAKTKKPIYDGKINIKIFVSSKRYYNYDGNTGANGKIKLLLDSLKPGKYKVIVSDGDNKNYTAKNVTSKIVIKKAPTKITAKKLTAKKGEKKNFKITVTNKKTKKAIPKIKVKAKVFTGKKSKTYTLKTNAKGIAKLNVNKLKVGKHKVTIKSANKYCVGKGKKSTITIKK